MGILSKQTKALRISIIVIQVLVLYLFNLLGEIITSMLRLPLPGSILGLLLLFICLHYKVIPAAYIKQGSIFLLALLPLFFIPATVGIIQYPEFLSGKGIILIVLVMISTFLTMIVAGRVSEAYEEKAARKEE